MIDFIQGTDVMIADSQYTMAEYPTKKGWGHGTFESNIEFWKLQSCDGVIDRNDAYCAAIPGEAYVIYMPEGGTGILKLPNNKSYSLKWFDPKLGGVLKPGSVSEVEGSDWIELGMAPKNDGRDWVLMIKAK